MQPHRFQTGSVAIEKSRATARHPNTYKEQGYEFGRNSTRSHRRPRAAKLTNKQRRLLSDITQAANIQTMLFPAALPELAGCELAARNRPALLCGGDYYDVLPESDSEKCTPYLLCVADVSGKGLPASLLMSNLQATLRTSIGYHPTLLDLVVQTNDLLYATTSPEIFITAILLHFEPETGRCNFVNAGHNGGILMRSTGKAEILNATGPPLGMMRSMPYISESIELHSGDLLILYSDGIPETFGPQDEEWGEERLVNFLSENRRLSSKDIVSRVFTEIDTFSQNTPQHDDVTILVLKRKKRES